MALVVFPILFLSGVFFPVDATPGWLSLVAKFNPATYGVDAIRQVVLLAAAPAATGLGEAATVVPLGHPSLGVSVFGHGLTIGEEVVILAILSTALIAWASRTLAREG
jgi:ABC-2 type transport system permease protein